ncbi:hypothetical protein Tco_1368256 [Tanacetum coccineum]
MDNIDTAFKSPQESDVKYSTINLRLTLLLKKESKRYNKDVKVTSIRNLDLQLFKVQLTEFGIGTEEGVAAELQELIGTEKNHNKGDVDVYGMMSIPVEAVAAYDSLNDDKELIHTYERLTALDGKRMFVLAAVGSHKKEVGRLSVCASALKVAPATATVCCFLSYSDFLSKVGGNRVQKVKVDDRKTQQDVGGIESDVSGSGVSKMQDLELLRSVAPKKRIVYTTTRPNDIKTPYEKMLENDVEFGAPDNRSSGFLKLCVDSQERAEILLQSLLDSYDQVIINLTSNVLSDYLVFDDVVAVILEEENRRNNNEDIQTSSRQVEALGNVSSTSEDGNALCCEATVANESRERFADVWLFDTGATFHMTARREWFHQYKPISRG